VTAGVFGPRVTRLSLCAYGYYSGTPSGCILPDMGKSIPALRSLCLRGYVHDIETHALERMSCLSELTLGGHHWTPPETPGLLWTTASSPHQWVHHLPTSLEILSVQSLNPEKETFPRPIFCCVTPCVTSLKNLRQLDFLRVLNLRPSEWEDPLWFHFSRLTKLELRAELELSCEMQAIPACVVSLSGLYYLDVSHNPLHGLPEGPYLSGLHSLVARHCGITAFPLEAISLATALQSLNLNGNDFAWTEEAREAVKHIAEMHSEPRSSFYSDCRWDWDLP
jgi:hypothetical protein